MRQLDPAHEDRALELEMANDAEFNESLIEKLKRVAEPIEDWREPDLDAYIERAGRARIVLLGESTHGTKEFYSLRAQISRRLIEEKGFNLILLEGDWPDVEGINHYIHARSHRWDGFHRFPEWMWRNKTFASFVEDLRDHNSSEANVPVSVFGLDLYSLSSSLHAVVDFFERRAPALAERVKGAASCLYPWQHDPAHYGLAVWHEEIKGCESDVIEILRLMHESRLESTRATDPELLSALQNARVVKNAEEYYRTMYLGSVESWNLRDRHMFETLSLLLDHFGSESKAIVWAHNSHVGDATATEVHAAGEINIGQLCRARFGRDAYITGFLTDNGTVAAADSWGGRVKRKTLTPSRPDSYEHLLHRTRRSAFFLPLRDADRDLRSSLDRERLTRAVGVLYLPQSERSSHYFSARLPAQFDEVVWIDTTSAVEPLKHVPETEEADTFPFGI